MPLLFVFMLFRHTGTPLPLIGRETGLTCEETSYWHASGTRIEHRVERVSTSRGKSNPLPRSPPSGTLCAGGAGGEPGQGVVLSQPVERPALLKPAGYSSMNHLT